MNACLIMGHKNPTQIIRLAKRLLEEEDNEVFIHLDSFMTEEETNLVEDFCLDNKSAHYCYDRIHGVLDKRSLVDIVFKMISKSKLIEENENKQYDYYLLFSGQDYPIKSINLINDELRKNYPKPYIDCTPYDKGNWIYHKFYYCRKALRFHDWITMNFRKGPLRSTLRAFAIIWTKMLSYIGADSYHKLKKEGVKIYGGSAWWILPDIIIDSIYNSYKNEDKVSELILNESVTPEETYFQIMSMRSPFSYMLEINQPDMVLQNCMTWAYFFDEEKIFKGHPYIFTMKEFDKLKTSNCWFARKFDINVDAKILDALDYMNQ